MKKNCLFNTTIVLFILLFFSMGIFTDASAAGKYNDYTVTQSCNDEVRKKGSKLYINEWAEWWPDAHF
jgi:hypothetical protein